MPLSALPAVLVQSLMHSLSAQDILSFARSSKWTLQCADSAFAWRDCPALDLYAFDEETPLPPPESRLCRWIPLSLNSSSDYLSDTCAAHLLVLMESCSRIVSL